MKFKFIYRFLILWLLFISGNKVVAQVVLPDTNFRNFLIAVHPSVMNPDKTLNVAAAHAYSGMFKCYNRNITNLSGIENFTSITTLEVKYNPNLYSIPNIDGLTNITVLGLDSNALTSLPNLSTLANLQILSFHHNNISSMPSLNGLTNLSILFVHNNNLTSIPDLSSLPNLSQFICSYNPLTSLPSLANQTNLIQIICDNTLITTLPDLSNCVQMTSILCRNHLLTSLPNFSNSPNLNELKVNNGKLTTLPDLSIFPSLATVDISNNALSFEDIKPLTSNVNYSSYIISPQAPGTITTVDALNTLSATIGFNFDNAINNSTYNWYKDGTYLTTTTLNKLSIPSISSANEGVYTCMITNTTPSLTDITLNAAPITLRVIPCISSNNLSYHIVNSDCSYPIRIQIDDSSFTSGTAPFSYKVKNKQDSSAFEPSTNFTLSKEGIYDLIVKDALGCEVTFNSKLIVPRNEQCDPVFYPNGDGIADTYFIEESGTAKIYNKNGEMVKELDTPANWDGTTKKGQDAPTGLYVIVVNGNTNIKVTLLR